MLQGVFYLVFTSLEVRDQGMITLNYTNQVLVWQCKKTWMITFLFKTFLSFFNKLVLGGMSLSNWHLLIMDGHGSHVTLEVIEQA